MAKPAERGCLPGFSTRIPRRLQPARDQVRAHDPEHSRPLLVLSGQGERQRFIGFVIFEDKEAAAESSRRAAEFVKNDPFKDQIGTPMIIEGELWVLREAPVTA
jgi:hypothetical protein